MPARARGGRRAANSGTPGHATGPRARPFKVLYALSYREDPVKPTFVWWPVTCPVASLPALPPPAGMLYLFLVQLPMQLLGAIITFAGQLLYPWYAGAPRTWGLSPLDDQRLGGLLLWVPGNLWI